jgi:hypothetical protein
LSQTVSISALPELTSANEEMQFPVNDAGLTKRVRFAAMMDMLRGFAIAVHGTVSVGSLLIDTNANRVHTVTLAASQTVFSVTAGTQPNTLQSALLVLTQDAVGNRSATFPASFRWQGGFSPSLSTAPGATDGIQLMTFDSGASWIASIAFQVAA